MHKEKGALARPGAGPGPCRGRRGAAATRHLAPRPVGPRPSPLASCGRAGRPLRSVRLAALLGLLGPGVAGASQCKLQRLAELPLTMHGLRALARGGVNGTDNILRPPDVEFDFERAGIPGS